ncbi:MAG: aminotransferase class I/II-fold pyridoxal phosphate-dependent enzyme [Lachnospiraceae bacterium]|nr:aminotransferase class I/II-fold pyridoxal phosphate-dependent enzyme [Lachnospiraceae bacterium]
MAHKHGGDVYTHSGVRDFSANINFRGMPASVREAAIRAVDRSVHYPDPDCRSLRRALADYENDGCHTTELQPGHIICGNGAAELMFALAGAYLPQRALLAVPSFYEYEQALDAFGCAICRYEMKAEQQFALGEDFLKAVVRFLENTDRLPVSGAEVPERVPVSGKDGAARADTRTMMILGSPNNPTGRVIETPILRALIELCVKNRVLLVLDESFFDFLSEADRTKTFSGAGIVPEVPDVFVIRSFTKIYALPGIRFGYGLCSDQQLLDGMRRLLQPWNVSLVAQEAAAAATHERPFARESARQVAVSREQMAAALREAGYEVFPSNTNFLLLRGPENLAEDCLRRGFLIRDCSNFPGLERTGDGLAYFRVCVRSQAENKALLEAMVSFRF